MNKSQNFFNVTLILILIILFVVGGETYVYFKKNTNLNAASTFDGKNATFTVGGKIFTLINGFFEMAPSPSSSSKITTRYFGNEAIGDLNGDGIKDTAFLITQGNGGSGIFYYAVVAIKNKSGYKTTNAFFIGDRIAPQTTEINSTAQELYINYAERKAKEPMTTKPSIGATKVLKVTSDNKLTDLIL
jgi:hypothetical protein